MSYYSALPSPSASASVSASASDSHASSPVPHGPAEFPSSPVQCPSSPTPNAAATFIVYRSRWFMLFLFSLLSMSSSTAWLTYAPISNLVEDIFQVNDFTLNLLSVDYMVVYVLFSWPSLKVLDKFGLKRCIQWCAWLNFIGTLLRILPYPFVSSLSETPSLSLGFAFLGQTCCSFAQLFIPASPVLMSSNWFGTHERSTATALAALANQLGSAVAFALPPLVLGERYVIMTDPEEISQSSPSMPLHWLVIAHAAIAGLAAVLIAAFFKERPPTPPSLSAAKSEREMEKMKKRKKSKEEQEAEEEQNGRHLQEKHPSPPTFLTSIATSSNSTLSPIIPALTDFPSSQSAEYVNMTVHESIVLVLKSRPFLILTLCFGINQGSGDAFATILNSILTSLDYSAFVISFCGILYIISGVSAYLSGYLADRTRKFKLLIFIAQALTTLFFAAFPLMPYLPPSQYLAGFFSFMLGFWQTASLPISLDLSVEVGFPMPAHISSQIQLISSNFFGLVLVLVFPLISDANQQVAGWLLFVVNLLATLLWMKFQGKSNRLEFEGVNDRQDEAHEDKQTNSAYHLLQDGFGPVSESESQSQSQSSLQ